MIQRRLFRAAFGKRGTQPPLAPVGFDRMHQDFFHRAVRSSFGLAGRGSRS